MWPFKKKKESKPQANTEFKNIMDSLYRPGTKRNVVDALTYEKETGDLIGKNFKTTAGDMKAEQATYILTRISSKFFKENGEKKFDSFYSFLSSYARHLVHLIKENDLKEFSGIFEAIEVIIKHGTADVSNAMVTGLLEDIQNIAGSNGIDPKLFEPHLFPESKKWWNEINRFWNDLEKNKTNKQ
ncbi:MAG TPA: hypothetical protein VHA30_02435 [Patescibacteria group bacterium]|nr:hypothetical protein [Patescibacteria group bacterium]